MLLKSMLLIVFCKFKMLSPVSASGYSTENHDHDALPSQHQDLQSSCLQHHVNFLKYIFSKKIVSHVTCIIPSHIRFKAFTHHSLKKQKQKPAQISCTSINLHMCMCINSAHSSNIGLCPIDPQHHTSVKY